MIDVSVYVSYAVCAVAIAAIGVGWDGLSYAAATLYIFAALWWVYAAQLRITEKRQLWAGRRECLDTLEELEERHRSLSADLGFHLGASTRSSSGVVVDPKAH